MYKIALNTEQDIIRQRARSAVEAMRNQSELNGNAAMSLEDINREIQQVRQNASWDVIITFKMPIGILNTQIRAQKQ